MKIFFLAPLLFPLTLVNTKFVPYTVRFRLFHSNPHNNLSSWYSYNYNLNFFRQPIPLDTRCIFIVLLFFVKKNTMFWGCVRWGNHFFINFLKNNVHQQWGFTFFSKKQKCVLKQKPFKNLLCFREKSKNRQLLRNGSEAQCGVNCFAYFFVLRFFSQSKIALVNFLHFQEKTCFFQHLPRIFIRQLSLYVLRVG